RAIGIPGTQILTTSLPLYESTANNPETAKTVHSTIRWNKIADVGILVDSKVSCTWIWIKNESR
ncbi:hypothetical protein N8152_00310, partial [bacterium]|nr:hypothetical protein [bacterium]